MSDPDSAPPAPTPEGQMIFGGRSRGYFAGNDIRIENFTLGTGPDTVPITPPAPDQSILGRDELVDEILAATREPDGRPWVLHGMGGGGKSSVAMTVAARLGATGEVDVYWVYGADLHQSMLSVAQSRPGADRAAILEARTNWKLAHDLVWRSLNSGTRRWLLVLDNVDQPALLAGPSGNPGAGDGWLRSSTMGLVLITSRNGEQHRWGTSAQLRKVGPLDNAIGAEVLLELAPGRGDRAEAARLSERLGGVPLALRLAGRYLADPISYPTYTAYREALDTELVDLIDLSRPEPSVSGPTELIEDLAARQSVELTWEMSLRMLTKQGVPLARPLLRLLSCFGGPHALRFDLLKVDTLHGSFLDPAGGLTQPEIDRTLLRLTAVSLVERQDLPSAGGLPPVPAMAFHPLVCEIIAATVASAEDGPQVWTTALACLTTATPDDPLEPRIWPRWRSLPPVYAAVLDRLPDGHVEHLSDALVGANACGAHLAATGALKEAHDLSQRIVERGRSLAKDDPARLLGRLTSTMVNRQEGNVAPLAGELTALLAEAESQLESDHALLTTIRLNLANVLTDLGRFEEAGELYRQILDGPGEPVRAASLGYGQLLLVQGRAEEAEPLLVPLLEQERAEHGPEHPATLAAREAVAGMFAVRGELDRAEREFQLLLEVQERLYGRDSLATLSSHTSLMGINSLRGEFGEAQGRLRTVLRIQKNSLNPEHPQALIGLSLLAVMQDNDDTAEAAERTSMIVRLLERSLTQEHPSVLAVRFQAAILRHPHDPDEAEDECLTVLRAQTRVFGGDHPVTLATRFMAAMMLCERDAVLGADALRDLRAVQLRVLGEHHPQTVQGLVTLARASYENSQLDRAEFYLREAIDCLTAMHGPDHEEVQEVRGGLVDVLVDQDRVAEAKTEMHALLESVRTTDGDRTGRVLGVRFLLAVLHFHTDAFADAERELRVVARVFEEDGGDLEERAIVMWLLGTVLHRTGKLAEAEQVLRPILAEVEQVEGPAAAETLELQVGLAEVLHERGQIAEAERLLQLATARLTEDEDADLGVLRRAEAALSAVSAALGEIGPAQEPLALPPAATPPAPVPVAEPAPLQDGDGPAFWRTLLAGPPDEAAVAELAERFGDDRPPWLDQLLRAGTAQPPAPLAHHGSTQLRPRPERHAAPPPDATRPDTTPFDAPPNATPPDTAPPDATPPNTAPSGIAPPGIAPRNIAPRNAIPSNATSPDAAPSDAVERPSAEPPRAEPAAPAAEPTPAVTRLVDDLPIHPTGLSERELRHRLAARPANPATWFSYAKALADNGFPLAAAAELTALDSTLRRGPDDTTLAIAVRIALAGTRLDRGEVAAAVRDLRRLVDTTTQRLGATHSLTTLARVELARANAANGRGDQAIRELREIADLPPARLTLARILLAGGDTTAAATECRRVLAVADEPADLLRARAMLAAAEADAATMAAVLDEARTRFGATHPEVADSAHQLGMLLLQSGRHAAARAPFRTALAIRRRRLGERHPATRATEEALARL
jgi:tetratricopeptide (TPR) repeat protein